MRKMKFIFLAFFEFQFFLRTSTFVFYPRPEHGAKATFIPPPLYTAAMHFLKKFDIQAKRSCNTVIPIQAHDD